MAAREATAFELLRGSRPAQQVSSSSASWKFESEAGAGAGAAGGAGARGGEWSFQDSFTERGVVADRRSRFSWALRGQQKVLYWSLVQPSGPPAFTHVLPEELHVPSALCVAVLPQSEGGLHRAPSTVALGNDFQVALFPGSESCTCLRLEGAPVGVWPSYLAAGATETSRAWLVVGLSNGRLLTLLIASNNGSMKAEASAPWPTTRSSGSNPLKTIWSKVRGLGGAAASAAAEGEATSAPASRSVQILPAPPGSGARFLALSLSDSAAALYAQPESESASAASLLWVASTASLIEADAGRSDCRLLSLQPNKLSDPTSLLLLCSIHTESTEGAGGEVEVSVTRLPWSRKALTEIPMKSGAGPSVRAQMPPGTSFRDDASKSNLAFLAPCGENAAYLAARAGDQEYHLKAVDLSQPGLALVGEKVLRSAVLGLVALPSSTGDVESATGVAALTPHGLFECPPVDGVVLGTAARDLSYLQGLSIEEALFRASSHFLAHRQEDSRVAVSWIFDTYDAGDVLAGVKLCTEKLLDADGMQDNRYLGVQAEVMTRHMLYDKSEDLEKWLSFLSACGTWAHLGGRAETTALQQYLVEALERVAATIQLRELDDVVHTAVFQELISKIPDQGTSASTTSAVARSAASSSSGALSLRQRYYSQVSACERILSSVAEYTANQTGTAENLQVNLFSNKTIASFLEAALDRRAQVMSKFPGLLPTAPRPSTGPCLASSLPYPRALGSEWLVAEGVTEALEALWKKTIEGVPASATTGEPLPLLQVQCAAVLDVAFRTARAWVMCVYASTADLQHERLVKLRAKLISSLASVEVASGVPEGAPRALQLALEFEDVEAIVALAGKYDVERLDKLLQSSQSFRKRALDFCIRQPQLRPLFFRAVRHLNLPKTEIAELVEKYPLVAWTLEVHSLGQSATHEDWLRVLGSISAKAAAAATEETENLVKRDALAALEALAKRAAAPPGAGAKAPPTTDVACLGRLQRLCRRYSRVSADTNMEDMENMQDDLEQLEEMDLEEAPVPPEVLLQVLTQCIKPALLGLHRVGAEGRFLSDLVHLVRLVEGELMQAHVDVSNTVKSLMQGEALAVAASQKESSPEAVVLSLQTLWKEVIVAEKGDWLEVLRMPESPERERYLSSLSFWRMAAWSRDDQGCAPRSMDLDALCQTFKCLQPLRPALRLVAEAGGGARLGCSAEVGLRQRVLFGSSAPSSSPLLRA